MAVVIVSGCIVWGGSTSRQAGTESLSYMTTLVGCCAVATRKR